MLRSDRFDRKKSQTVSQLKQVIDKMGEASAKVSIIIIILGSNFDVSLKVYHKW